MQRYAEHCIRGIMLLSLSTSYRLHSILCIRPDTTYSMLHITHGSLHDFCVFLTAGPTSRRRRDSRAETPAALISRSQEATGELCPGAATQATLERILKCRWAGRSAIAQRLMHLKVETAWLCDEKYQAILRSRFDGMSKASIAIPNKTDTGTCQMYVPMHYNMIRPINLMSFPADGDSTETHSTLNPLTLIWGLTAQVLTPLQRV